MGYCALGLEEIEMMAMIRRYSVLWRTQTCILQFLLVVVLFSSCAPLKFRSPITQESILQETLRTSAFKYPNAISDSGSYATRTLWHLIQPKGIIMESKESLDDLDAEVHIQLQEKEEVVFKLMRGDQQLSERKVKGTWQDGWFISKTRTKMMGLPLVYFVLAERRFRMGLDPAGALKFDVKAGRLGMILLLHAGPVWEENYAFNKKK